VEIKEKELPSTGAKQKLWSSDVAKTQKGAA
jgi:hypothetical protein